MQDIEQEIEAQRRRELNERNEIVEMRASLRKAEETVERLRVEAALAAANAPPPQLAPMNALADWHRRPDLAKVRVVAAEAVSRDLVTAVVAQHCGYARLLEEHYSLQEGRELSKSYVVTFLGEPRLAARRAAMLLATMRSADGAWRQPSVKTPSGAEARIWSDPDKNGKQMKGEAAVRRLLRAFRAAAPEKRVFANMAELSVTASWRPLARVVMGEASEEANFEWNLVALASFGVPRAAVEAELQENGRQGSAGVAWCSKHGGGVGRASGGENGLVERQVVAGVLAQSASGEGGASQPSCTGG